MTIYLQLGEQIITDLSSGVLGMIHGGASPRDPRGEKGIQAREQFRKIQNEIQSDKNFFPEQLKNKISGLERTSDAEIFCLKAANLLELEPMLNAGRGSALQADGVARVSAGFMESKRKKFSAVMNVQNILHPSELAYFLQFERYSVLDSSGATNLYRELDMPEDNLVTDERFLEWQKLNSHLIHDQILDEKTGTIGAVAISRKGDLAAVTSTGGLGNETVGRVGDSPTVAGTYCSDIVAVSCTGIGEQIISQAFAARLAVRMEDGHSLEKAFHTGLTEAANKGYLFGAIAVAYDRERERAYWSAGTTTSAFLWSAYTPNGWIMTDI